MARPRKSVPSYLLHTATGQARAVWTDATGERHDVLLPGPHNSEESVAAFGRLLVRVKTAPLRRLTPPPAALTVAELLLAYLTHARAYYRGPDGKPTAEVGHVRQVVKITRELFGRTPAADFGPLALKAVRQRMVDLGWARRTVNQRTEKLKRAVRWAVGEQLVSPVVYEGLRAVAGLRSGKTEAPDPAPVEPADPAAVDATLPYLNRHVRAMVELQRLTGMRPGEVCRVRLADIDRAGELWVYQPGRHKTAHRGQHRTIIFGPKAQAVITAFVAGGSVIDPAAPLFSPARAREERYAALREARKSKVPPSQRNRRKRKPKLQPAAGYDPRSYAHAVRSAVGKANRAEVETAGKEGREPDPIPAWHPNQLRHLYAAELRKAFTLEHVRAALGHSRAAMSDHYSKGADASLAGEVARRMG